MSLLLKKKKRAKCIQFTSSSNLKNGQQKSVSRHIYSNIRLWGEKQLLSPSLKKKKTKGKKVSYYLHFGADTNVT